MNALDQSGVGKVSVLQTNGEDDDYLKNIELAIAKFYGAGDIDSSATSDKGVNEIRKSL